MSPTPRAGTQCRVDIVSSKPDFTRHLAYSRYTVDTYLLERREKRRKDSRQTERFRKVSKMIQLGNGEVRIKLMCPVRVSDFSKYPSCGIMGRVGLVLAAKTQSQLPETCPGLFMVLTVWLWAHPSPLWAHQGCSGDGMNFRTNSM